MARELVTTVVLVDENGVPVIFNAGDTPEKKYADQITNPKAWGEAVKADDEAADESEEEAVSEEAAPAQDDDDDSEPPRSGKGSGKQAWADYAATKGIELEDGASAQDYQDAVDAL